MSTDLTFGQLSVWHDVERMPLQRRHEANLLQISPVDEGVSVSDLIGALRDLCDHHEALRTTYDFGTEPRQIVHPAGSVTLPIECAPVEPGDDAETVAQKLGEELKRRPFDLAVEPSWRAVILTADGRPVQLLVLLHHIAVDIFAINLLSRDFTTLLGGGRPEPADSPSALAIAQRSARWEWWNQQTEEYLRTAYTAVARSGGIPIVESPAAVIRATLHSSVGRSASTRLAQALKVSVPSLVLAAYSYAAHRLTQADHILVNAMSANRGYPGSAALVSSMNQWGVVASQWRPDEPFDQFARRCHWANVRAYRHGCYDPYVADRIRDEVATAIGPVLPEFCFNFVRTEAADAPPAVAAPDAAPFVVEQEVPTRNTGPSFYLVATESEHLSLTGRVMWEGFDHNDLATFLATVHEVLTREP